MRESAMQQCIVCDAKLEVAMEGQRYNQPYKGTTFQSHGHYGSTFWDPMSGTRYIEITVCDECLTEAKARGRILSVTQIPSPSTIDYEILNDSNHH